MENENYHKKEGNNEQISTNKDIKNKTESEMIKEIGNYINTHLIRPYEEKLTEKNLKISKLEREVGTLKDTQNIKEVEYKLEVGRYEKKIEDLFINLSQNEEKNKIEIKKLNEDIRNLQKSLSLAETRKDFYKHVAEEFEDKYNNKTDEQIMELNDIIKMGENISKNNLSNKENEKNEN